MTARSRYTNNPRFLADANFNLHIVAGLRRLQPLMDIATSQQMNILAMDDPALLRFAQAADRILLTHDRKTMPGHVDELLLTMGEGEHFPGVMLVAQRLPIGTAIEAILMVWACSTHDEWRDQFVYLPL